MKPIYSNVNAIPFENPIDRSFIAGFEATADTYKFRLTEHLRQLIDSTNNDGLRKQFLPQADEMVTSSTEFYDVADEAHFEPVTGIIHRYPTKVLLMLTLNCPTYCRFCFRKEKLNNPVYGKFLTSEQREAAFRYIEGHDIDEVIFSGGDIFFCSDRMIEDAVNRLLKIPMVKIVRYHTRLFTFEPQRITDELVSIIRRKRTTFVVMHVNQVEEITPQMEIAIARCVDNGIPLFSQTALLKGINDNHDALKNLFTRLVHLRVKPYYLFHTDPGRGIGHFRVKLADGIALYRSLYDRISGLAMPIYLFNVPGGYGHVILDLGNVKRIEEEIYELITWQGTKVIYRDY